MNRPSIHWFRLDLRLADNPALRAAIEHDGPVVPVFVWSPEEEGAWPPGGVSLEVMLRGTCDRARLLSGQVALAAGEWVEK